MFSVTRENLPTIERFVVTGVLYRSKRRFSHGYPNTISLSGYRQAMMINLWNGSVWAVINSKRHLIKRVHN